MTHNLDMAIEEELMALENEIEFQSPDNKQVKESNAPVLMNNYSTSNSSINNTSLMHVNQSLKEKSYQDLEDFLTTISSNPKFQSKSQLVSALEKANNHITVLSKEIMFLTKDIREIYNKKFPDLPTIVTNPHDYVKTVKLLEEKTALKADLFAFLPNNVFIALTVIHNLNKIQWNEEQTNELFVFINKCLQLYHFKEELLKFISKNMNTIAPNLTALLGSDISGKLITSVGGIMELAKTSSGHLINIGSHAVNLEGASTGGYKMNNGYLTELEEYKKSNDKMKVKVLRRYANKAVLAARIDAFRNNSCSVDINEPSIQLDNDADDDHDDMLEATVKNTYGKKLKEVIGEKIEKIMNNKQPVLVKPLPRPDDKPRRKRGGKRARSLKKRYEQTEIRTMKNRMAFGPEGEMEYRETGEGFGMLKIGGIGSKMKTSKDPNQKIITKKQRIYDMQYGTGNTSQQETSLGIHSSVVMTPHEGIELINPKLHHHYPKQSHPKYFNHSSGFSTVIKNRIDEI